MEQMKGMDLRWGEDQHHHLRRNYGLKTLGNNAMSFNFITDVVDQDPSSQKEERRSNHTEQRCWPLANTNDGGFEYQCFELNKMQDEKGLIGLLVVQSVGKKVHCTTFVGKTHTVPYCYPYASSSLIIIVLMIMVVFVIVPINYCYHLLCCYYYSYSYSYSYLVLLLLLLLLFLFLVLLLLLLLFLFLFLFLFLLFFLWLSLQLRLLYYYHYILIIPLTLLLLLLYYCHIIVTLLLRKFRLPIALSSHYELQ